MISVRTLLWLLALAFTPFAARAHLPGESSLAITADSENLEILVSVSLPSATSLLSPDAVLSAATLDQHRAALLAAAPRVCTLLDSSGKTIGSQRVLVSIFQDHEVRFHFLFPPSSRPARLRMPLLAALRGEAFCVVADLRRDPPSRAILTPESPEHSFASSSPSL